MFFHFILFRAFILFSATRTTTLINLQRFSTGVECVDADGQVVEPTQCLLGKTMVPESSVECQVECTRPCVLSSWSSWSPCPAMPPCGTASVRKRQLLGGWIFNYFYPLSYPAEQIKYRSFNSKSQYHINLSCRRLYLIFPPTCGTNICRVDSYNLHVIYYQSKLRKLRFLISNLQYTINFSR